MGWVMELRYNGERLGTMIIPSYEEALAAVREYGGLYSEIKWPDGTEQFSNKEGHSLLLYAA